MTREEAQQRVNKLLLEATEKLVEAGKIVCEESLDEQMFMGMVFEPQIGWISPDGELQRESEWNYSDCVIGSRYARGYGMEGWRDRGNSSWKLDGED